MKFRVIDLNTGKKVKPDKGEMLALNPEGQVFLVSGIGDYYTYIKHLSIVIPSYVVEFAMKKDVNGRWVYESSVMYKAG